VLVVSTSRLDVCNIPQPLHLPLPAEAGEAGQAGEELLHGSLLEVALLGDEPIQPAQQRIHIAQRRRDRALFGEGRTQDGNSRTRLLVQLWLCSASVVLLVVAALEELDQVLGCHACSRSQDMSVVVYPGLTRDLE